MSPRPAPIHTAPVSPNPTATRITSPQPNYTPTHPKHGGHRSCRQLAVPARPHLWRRVVRLEVQVVCMRCARRLEVAQLEPHQAEGPVRRARAAGVARPDVLVGINVQFDAVAGGECEELAEVVDVVVVVVAPTKVVVSRVSDLSAGSESSGNEGPTVRCVLVTPR